MFWMCWPGSNLTSVSRLCVECKRQLATGGLTFDWLLRSIKVWDPQPLFPPGLVSSGHQPSGSWVIVATGAATLYSLCPSLSASADFQIFQFSCLMFISPPIPAFPPSRAHPLNRHNWQLVRAISCCVVKLETVKYLLIHILCEISTKIYSVRCALNLLKIFEYFPIPGF